MKCVPSLTKDEVLPLFLEAFDIWYENSGSFYSFLLRFALLKELCWLMVVLQDFVKVIHFFCKKVRCRTYLFSSVDEGVDYR